MELRAVLNAIAQGDFSPDEPKRFEGLVEGLLAKDRFMVLADYQSYRSCHQGVLDVWSDLQEWKRRSIMNTSNVGRFSSDVDVRSYARDTWKVDV